MARLTVEFNKEAAAILDRLSKKEGRTKVEMLRRMIGLYSVLEREIATGVELALVDASGKVTKKLGWF